MLNEEEGPSSKACDPSEHLICLNQVDARQKSKRKPGGAQLRHDAVFPNGAPCALCPLLACLRVPLGAGHGLLGGSWSLLTVHGYPHS